MNIKVNINDLYSSLTCTAAVLVNISSVKIFSNQCNSGLIANVV